MPLNEQTISFFFFYHAVLSAQTCRFPDETKKKILGPAEGERRNVEDARLEKRRGVLLSHSRVPLARPRILRRLSQTAPAP